MGGGLPVSIAPAVLRVWKNDKGAGGGERRMTRWRVSRVAWGFEVWLAARLTGGALNLRLFDTREDFFRWGTVGLFR